MVLLSLEKLWKPSLRPYPLLRIKFGAARNLRLILETSAKYCHCPLINRSLQFGTGQDGRNLPHSYMETASNLLFQT